jgi:two-component system chemotaxis response regulator CheY
MPRVLSVGQCGFDHGQIARHLKQAFGAEVVGAHTRAEALEALCAGRFDLVLVNRVIDADGSYGLDLIRDLRADPTPVPVPVMLVSNYLDAQQKAVALGAHPGFGKSELGQPQTHEKLKRVLAGPRDETPRPSAAGGSPGTA